MIHAVMICQWVIPPLFSAWDAESVMCRRTSPFDLHAITLNGLLRFWVVLAYDYLALHGKLYRSYSGTIVQSTRQGRSV